MTLGEDTRRGYWEGRQRSAVQIMKCMRDWKDRPPTPPTAAQWLLYGGCREETSSLRSVSCFLFRYLKLSAHRTERPKPIHGWGTSRVSYQGEALGGRRPPLHRGEGPLLNHIFGPLVHSHHRLFGDAQETRHQLVFALHLFLWKEIQRTEKKKLWRVTSTKDKEDLDQLNQTASTERASCYDLKTLANFVYSPSAPNFRPRSLITCSVKCVIRKAFRGIYAVAMITWTQTIGTKS